MFHFILNAPLGREGVGRAFDYPRRQLYRQAPLINWRSSTPPPPYPTSLPLHVVLASCSWTLMDDEALLRALCQNKHWPFWPHQERLNGRIPHNGIPL